MVKLLSEDVRQLMSFLQNKPLTSESTLHHAESANEHDKYVKEVSAKKARKEEDPCRLLQLPTDLQYDIFSRLSSFKELCFIRSVCKDISIITESTGFTSMRLGRADPEVFVLAKHLVNGFMTIHKPDLNGISNNIPQTMNVQYKAFLPKLVTKYVFLTIRIDSTCNGFVCFSRLCSNVICNPITREYAFIPKPMETEEYVRTWFDKFGFGCNTEGKEYKVVRLVKGCSVLSNLTSIFAEVYRLGDDSWKTIGIVPNVEICVGSSVFLNGVIYRLCIGLDGSSYILCFDVESERFSSLHLPCCLYHEEDYRTEFAALRGFLCVSRVVDTKELEIWVVKDGCWTKMLTVTIKPPCLNIFVWKPLSWSENDELVFLCDDMKLVCYNLVAGTFREIEVKGDSKLSICPVVTLEPSFGSLKDIFKGENIEIFDFRPEDITK